LKWLCLSRGAEIAGPVRVDSGPGAGTKGWCATEFYVSADQNTLHVSTDMIDSGLQKRKTSDINGRGSSSDADKKNEVMFTKCTISPDVNSALI
jgi:hypothetical protein